MVHCSKGVAASGRKRLATPRALEPKNARGHDPENRARTTDDPVEGGVVRLVADEKTKDRNERQDQSDVDRDLQGVSSSIYDGPPPPPEVRDPASPDSSCLTQVEKSSAEGHRRDKRVRHSLAPPSGRSSHSVRDVIWKLADIGECWIARPSCFPDSTVVAPCPKLGIALTNVIENTMRIEPSHTGCRASR